ASEPPKEIVPYYEIGEHMDIEDFPRLLADMDARRLAGLIMLTPPTMLEKTALVVNCPIPRVYIGADVCWRYQIPSVSTDVRSFIGRAVEFATRRGRRRPVMI